jgi:hypothetical protein
MGEGDFYTIREVGGSELERHYPDRGLIGNSNWYNAILIVDRKAGSFLGWLVAPGPQSFGVVLSANAEGLRVLVSREQFAIFIPWSQAAVSAMRSLPATVVNLQTAAVPSLGLKLHLDDAAADDLFRDVVPPLPQRDPAGRLFWLKPWALVGLVAAMLVVAGYLASLRMPWPVFTALVVLAAVLLWLGLIVLRPLIEKLP